MGHDDKWARGPPGGGWGEYERGGDREWGRRDMGGGGGGGGGSHWERDPAWMHDGQEAGAAVTAARTLAPPPTTQRGAVTARDIERERQEMQAAWRAQAANKVRA